MKILPYIGFCFLLLCALCTGVNSYHRTKSIIAQDVNRALEQVLAKMLIMWSLQILFVAIAIA